MENVVYIVGAGFSKPLGLPVMSNFYSMSKDMFAKDQSRYPNFGNVFERIDAMARIMKFFKSSQFNIEEVLSIMEMSQSLDGDGRVRESFARYICDVINFYTPRLPAPPESRTSWYNYICHGEQLTLGYLMFVANLLGIDVRDARLADPGANPGGRFDGRVGDRDFRYSVVSLNYDRVLENAASHLMRWFNAPALMRRPGVGGNIDGPTLAKLHGCVSGGQIVPPTWNKYLHENIVVEWREAHHLLRTANHIRVIGYSLPESDAYVRYLLKSASNGLDNLKSLDVICYDPEGDVRARYEAFVAYPTWRFFNATTETYLSYVARHDIYPKVDFHVVFNQLERCHGDFAAAGAKPI